MKVKTGLGIVLAMAVLLSVVIPVQGQSTGPIYVVQAGDTLTGIARRFGTSVVALAELNGIEDASRLFVGMELVIPGYEGVAGYFGEYKVQFGDTLDVIARQSGLSGEQLMALNHIVNPERIFVGQTLNVIESEEESSSQDFSRALQPQQSKTRLELAVENQVNPWLVSSEFGRTTDFWLLPGQYLVFGKETIDPSPFPEPILDMSITPSPAVQGKTHIVRIETSEPIWFEGDLGEYPLEFHPVSDTELVAIQGIHALQEPGLYDLEVRAYPAEGLEQIYGYRQPIEVAEGGYGFQRISGVPPETVDPVNIQNEDAVVLPLLAPVSAERFWDGVFEYPSTYYTTDFLSNYGLRRDYNNGALDYYHTGLDFYGADVPIYAPAAGRVVFTGPLMIRGNATYIDHGWGVYTGYLHQSEVYVSEGELVEAGQLIGQVGNTGRSTGPHLHWEIWVGEIPVDPIEWVEAGFP